MSGITPVPATSSTHTEALRTRVELAPFAVRLAPNPVRSTLDGLIELAGMGSVFGTISNIPRTAFDEMAKLPGLRVLEKRSYFEDENQYRCAEFALARLLPDKKLNVPERRLLNSDPLKFLIDCHFAPVQGAAQAELVVYGNVVPASGGHDFDIHHLGVVSGDKIISKFDQGDVFEHALEAVPQAYGDWVVFMTRPLQSSDELLNRAGC